MEPRAVRARMSRMARAISFQRVSGSPSQPWPKLTITRPVAVSRCRMARSAISSAVGGRAPGVGLGQAPDAGGVARRGGRDGPLVPGVERVLGGEAAPLQGAARQL